MLADAFGRIRREVLRILGQSEPADLLYRPDPDANTVAWLIWHLTRVMDDHVSEIADTEQTWTRNGWVESFALPLSDSDTGYGHSPEQVGQVKATREQLTGYHEAVQDQVAGFLEQLEAPELDRIIDEGWDPPVSAGVRLVSVIGDGYQHVGQAAYVLGLSLRARS